MTTKKHPPMVAAIIQHNGKILCLDHVKEGKWTIPMGKVDEGEKNPLNAIRRELFEELDMTNVQTKHVVSVPLKMFTGDFAIWDVYKVNRYTGVIINKEPLKHLGLKYYSVAELQHLSDQNKAGLILRYLLDSNIFH